MSIAAMDQELRRINSVTLEVLEAVTGCLSALPAPGERIVKEEWDTVVFQFDTAEMKHQHVVSSLSRVVGKLSSGLERHHAKATELHRLQSKLDELLAALRRLVKD